MFAARIGAHYKLGQLSVTLDVAPLAFSSRRPPLFVVVHSSKELRGEHGPRKSDRLQHGSVVAVAIDQVAHKACPGEFFLRYAAQVAEKALIFVLGKAVAPFDANVLVVLLPIPLGQKSSTFQALYDPSRLAVDFCRTRLPERIVELGCPSAFSLVFLVPYSHGLYRRTLIWRLHGLIRRCLSNNRFEFGAVEHGVVKPCISLTDKFPNVMRIHRAAVVASATLEFDLFLYSG